MPICLECNAVPDKTLLCSSCKVSQYCSKKCQKKAWSTHKRDCRAVAKIRSRLKENPRWSSFVIEPGAKFSGKAIREFHHECVKKGLYKKELFDVSRDEYFARMEIFNLAELLTNMGFQEGNQMAILETLDLYAALIKKKSGMTENIIQLSTILLFAAGRVQESYDMAKACLITDSELKSRKPFKAISAALDGADVLEDTLDEVGAIVQDITLNYGLWICLIIIKFYVLQGMKRRLEGRKPVEEIDSTAASKGQRFPRGDVLFKDLFDTLDLKEAVAKQEELVKDYGSVTKQFIAGSILKETQPFWVECLAAGDRRKCFKISNQKSLFDPWAKPRWYMFEAMRMGGVLEDVLVWVECLKTTEKDRGGKVGM